MSEIQDAEKTPQMDENGNAKPASQALLDLEASGLTPEDLADAARSAAEEAEKLPPPPPAAWPPLHWLLLLLLSAAGTLALAWSGGMESFRLWGLAGLVLLLLLVSALPNKARLCPRLATRGGLAAALLSAALLIQTLTGHPAAYFQLCPAPLAWAGFLLLALLWTIVAVLRKLGRHPAVAAPVIILLFYAATAPATALLVHFEGPELTWAALNASPAFMTGALPWVIWPMTFILWLALPLAVLLSLWDQCSSLRRRGARHGGGFFLALAWLGLFFSGLLLFDPMAESRPVKKVRSLAPVLAGVEAGTPAAPPVMLQPRHQPAAAQPAAAPPPPETEAAQNEEALRVLGLGRRV
ncbi:MAG: hypothetical protein FWG97_02910, partial [Deltaproteobacteria bacterium]|nr:hypothetical protein [Deltaproteobacteria bacterium]